MNASQLIRSLGLAALFAPMVCLAAPDPVEAAPGAAKAAPRAAESPKAVAATNAPVEIPASEFTVDGGRNPFFPASSRASGGLNAANSGKTATQTALLLQGISGRFALINGRTLAVNEEADVSIGSGRVHLRLLAINDGSVTVDVDGKSVDLKLRSGI